MGKSYEIPIRISILIEVTVEADSLKEAQQKALTFKLDKCMTWADMVPVDDGEDGQWCEFDQTTKLEGGE